MLVQNVDSQAVRPNAARKDTSMDSKPDPARITGEEIMAGTLDGTRDDRLDLSKVKVCVSEPACCPAVSASAKEPSCPVLETLQITEVKFPFHSVDSQTEDPMRIGKVEYVWSLLFPVTVTKTSFPTSIRQGWHKDDKVHQMSHEKQRVQQ